MKNKSEKFITLELSFEEILNIRDLLLWYSDIEDKEIEKLRKINTKESMKRALAIAQTGIRLGTIALKMQLLIEKDR